LNPNGIVSKHRARLVARGFLQRYHIYYAKVFSHVARIETIILIVALTISKNWSMFHLDVKSAFLIGSLKEIMFVTQPPGFEVKRKEHVVYKLHKTIYGLKLTPRA